MYVDFQEEARAPLPRLRTGSWLNPEPYVREDQRHGGTGSPPRAGDDDARFRDQDRYTRDQETRFRDQDPDRRGRESNVRFQDSFDHGDQYQRSRDRDHDFLDRRPSRDHSGHEADASRRESEPRCADHQALHDAQFSRQRRDDGEDRHDRDSYTDGGGRRLGSVSEGTELQAKGAVGREEQGGGMASGYSREGPGVGELRRDSSVTSFTRERRGADRRESRSDQDPGVRSQDTDSQESDRRRQETQEREEEERRREQEREEWRRKEEQERRQQAEREALERQASVVSSTSSNGETQA